MDRNLFGFWQMTAMRYLSAEGKWINETVYGGTSVFTSNGNIMTYTRTSEIGFGYSGVFSVQGNNLVIDVQVCSIQELEGTKIIRTVERVTPESLTLSMTDAATGRHYEIDFNLLTSSFT